jgi:hypothetical protein
MAPAPGYSTRSSRSGFAGVILLTLLAGFPACPASAEQEEGLGAVFLAQLLEGSAHRLGGGQGCLIEGGTVGGELSAILAFIEADRANVALGASCEAQADGMSFCTWSLATETGGEQASAGFVFRAGPEDRRIDLASLQCFQTP